MGPGVKDGYAVIALFGIFLWTTLGVNTGVVASEFDAILSSESYQSNQQHRAYKIRRAAQDPNSHSKDIPTITGDSCGDIRTQATELHKAIEGDIPQSLIDILSKCTREQRQKIADAYTEIYHKALVATLKDKYSSDEYFSFLASSLIVPLPEFLGDYLFSAINNDEFRHIIYCLTPLVNDSTTAAMQQVFVKRNGGPITEGTTSAMFNDRLKEGYLTLIKSEYNGMRSSIDYVDEKAACADADKIIKEKESRKTHDVNGNFYRILMNTSFSQLRIISKCFKNRTRSSLLESGLGTKIIMRPLDYHRMWRERTTKMAIFSILQYAEDKAKFFAMGLNYSIKGWGTDDELLMFIIASRADVDLGNIKKVYQQLYQKSLYDDVAEDTSGEYRDLLLALIGK